MADVQSIVKELSKEARAVIASFENIPYYNNRRSGARFGLRARIGKGSPEEIADEAMLFSLREKVKWQELAPETRKKFLVDHRLGIDCSAFAYYILDTEARARGKGSLQRFLAYPYADSLLARLGRFARARYAENAGTRTFAHQRNSREVALLDVTPGDFIAILDSGSNGDSNHIMIVYRVSYEQNVPTELGYVHSIAWPTDGRYGHGVREGKIVIKNVNHPLLEQTWLEAGQTGPSNFTYHKATGARVLSLRRLNCFQ